jgi:hypothetical protein
LRQFFLYGVTQLQLIFQNLINEVAKVFDLRSTELRDGGFDLLNGAHFNTTIPEDVQIENNLNELSFFSRERQTGMNIPHFPMDMSLLIANGKVTARSWRGIFLLFCLVLNLAANGADRGISVQGRVTTNNVAFTGTGKFKFALIDGLNGPALWTHDGTSAGVSHEPASSINLPVTRGIFSTLLGDRSIPGMTQALDPAIFASTDIRVRIWFDDGVNGSQLLTPDQKLSASSYAFNADRAREATAFTGNITISQVPSIVVTNGATNVNFTGSFTGDGSGLVGIRGSTPFQVVSGTDIEMVPNTGYLVTNSVETTLLLPTNTIVRVGDIVRVSGPNAGSWKITQSTNQSIVSGGFPRGIGAIWVQRDTARTWTDINCSADGRVLVATVSSAPTFDQLRSEFLCAVADDDAAGELADGGRLRGWLALARRAR